jgi:quercetin dioxygenase-like cupin family protein
VVEGEERRLGPGDAITIPAGTPHYFVNDGKDDAVSIQEFRPALHTADFFKTLFALAEEDVPVAVELRGGGPVHD